MDGLSGDTADTPHSLTTPDWMPPLDFCINIIAIIAVLEMQKVAQSLHNDKKQLTRDEEVNLLELRGPDPVVCPALVGARLPPGHRLQGQHRGHRHRAGGLPGGAW